MNFNVSLTDLRIFHDSHFFFLLFLKFILLTYQKIIFFFRYFLPGLCRIMAVYQLLQLGFGSIFFSFIIIYYRYFFFFFFFFFLKYE